MEGEKTRGDGDQVGELSGLLEGSLRKLCKARGEGGRWVFERESLARKLGAKSRTHLILEASHICPSVYFCLKLGRMKRESCLCIAGSID